MKTEEVRLSWINRIYEKANLAPLIKADPNRVLTIDNLTALHKDRASINNHVKVSVIVPVYNSQKSLQHALRGLIAQSWQDVGDHVLMIAALMTASPSLGPSLSKTLVFVLCARHKTRVLMSH